MNEREDSGQCPCCGGELTFGYGLAGGGLGGYRFCLDCGELIDKHRTDPGECLHNVLTEPSP